MAQAKQENVTGPRFETTDGRTDISQDTLYEMLANRRRRYVIHYLQRYEGDVALGTLAEQVAAWEYETDVDGITSAQRKSVYTALQQRHLPKLDEAGLVSFDQRAGTITPTDTLTEVEIYTEVVPSGDFPWSQYYLGLSVVTAALLGAVWLNVPALSALPDIAWGVFCVTALMVSSLVHVYMTRGMKLGTEKRPPEVERTREES